MTEKRGCTLAGKKFEPPKYLASLMAAGWSQEKDGLDRSHRSLVGCRGTTAWVACYAEQRNGTLAG